MSEVASESALAVALTGVAQRLEDTHLDLRELRRKLAIARADERAETKILEAVGDVAFAIRRIGEAVAHLDVDEEIAEEAGIATS